MSYLSKMEYAIIPDGSYKVIRNCGKCGCKSTYVNTNNFRINANGNRVDVWLIYQCQKCKHTYNLTIYERIRPADIKKEYDRFLKNDLALAVEYGNKKELFTKNKAEIDRESITYHLTTADSKKLERAEAIHIYNPYEIKLRVDKILSEILSLNRKQIKQLIEDGKIKVANTYLARNTEIILSLCEELTIYGIKKASGN